MGLFEEYEPDAVTKVEYLVKKFWMGDAERASVELTALGNDGWKVIAVNLGDSNNACLLYTLERESQ
jgi:hypothetical protein